MNKLGFPNVEVIENGKPVPQERIDPSVASFIAQMAQTAQLVKLRKLEESKVPTGTKSFSATVSTEIMKLSLSPPWISFSLINDGLGSVKVAINDKSELLYGTAIASGETYNLDFTYATIHTIYLQAVSGTAAIRIKAKVGQSNLRDRLPV